MSLIQHGLFVAASKKILNWKIECDSFTDDDWQSLAKIIIEYMPAFKRVVGVPRGGLKLAEKLQPYCIPSANVTLVVDDVWTTGKSMKEFCKQENITDAYFFVVFLRGPDNLETDYMFKLNDYMVE